MTAQQFLHRVANGERDVVQLLLDLLRQHDIDYCLVGGLAVNAYAEPVVSLDLDIIVATAQIEKLKEVAKPHFRIKEFAHSVNLDSGESELRVQIQTDPRYQAFLERAVDKRVMGYDFKVAAVEDVLQGKIWAFQDEQRRKSKRQKDLADIARLVEAHPHLEGLLPKDLKPLLT